MYATKIFAASRKSVGIESNSQIALVFAPQAGKRRAWDYLGDAGSPAKRPGEGLGTRRRSAGAAAAVADREREGRGIRESASGVIVTTDAAAGPGQQGFIYRNSAQPERTLTGFSWAVVSGAFLLRLSSFFLIIIIFLYYFLVNVP